ncbi:hypothetical protein ABT282_31010 [Streptomyces sp. NPDC000927]|uniref:hypothetical protein n=1 Tax=Streptomyces sp. NPDC000927 TaxID=3154371 RepID=UPI0033224784
MTRTQHNLSIAADHLRLFNHESMRASKDWRYPSDTYAALAQITVIAQRLPQVIEQAIVPVEHVHREGRLVIDGGDDPDEAMRSIREAVRRASECAATLAKLAAELHAEAHDMGAK